MRTRRPVASTVESLCPSLGSVFRGTGVGPAAGQTLQEKTMNDEDIDRLQDEDEWDFEGAEWQQARAGHRAIVAVGFTTADFAVVSAAARELNQSVSQFILEAALGQAHDRDG